MGQIGYLETSVKNFESTLRNIPKERGGNLKSHFSSCYTSNVLGMFRMNMLPDIVQVLGIA